MIDPQRNLSTTYRFTDVGGLYEVTLYPKAPTPIVTERYRMDMLPVWVQEAIHLLDWAHPEEVRDVGRKIGQTYWIDAQYEEFRNFIKALDTVLGDD
jgi:hypothetical protein